MEQGTTVLVVAGPTASGKSALALALAERANGVVINADSMQVYRELRILTARPGLQEERRAPHRLYGVLAAAEPCSAGRWRALALAEIAAARSAGRLPILCGGTGLYLEALTHGIAALPPVPEPVRAAAQAFLARHGSAAMHAALAARDPASAARLRPSDRQRVQRAWEVLEATGRPIGEWQTAREPPPGDLRFRSVLLLPPRETLYPAIDARVLAMIEAGALEEVRRLVALGLSPDLPAMKAVGVAPLAAHLRGEIALSQAIRLTQRDSRRYAKRQSTWFRHRLRPDVTVDAQFSESRGSENFAKIWRFLLTHGT